MKRAQRGKLRGLLLIPLFGGIFWATALLASTVPGWLVLGVNVHGLGVASYAGEAGGSVAPLSPKIFGDVSQDTAQGLPATSTSHSPSPAPTTAASASPSPSPMPLPTVTPPPSVLPAPTPSPTPTPTATPIPMTGRATINGQVIDTVTQIGIAGAQVTLSSGGSTIADVNGNFTFGVNPGSYTLTASATGYSSASQTVSVNGGQKLLVTIKLTSLTATGGVKGTVTSSATGTAIVAAVVSLSNGLTTMTDISGAYSFPAVLYGSYTITATAPGYVSQSQPVAVKPGHTTTLNFSLMP